MAKFSRNIFAILGATILVSSPLWAVINPSNQIVDFRLFYPFISIKDPSVRVSQKNYLGLSIPYLFFPTLHFGVVLEPSLLVVPVARGDSKVKYFVASANAGGVVRFLPTNWFDPMIQCSGGIGASDAGHLVDLRTSFPISTRLSLNLYSINDQYQDNTLALTASSSFFYVANSIDIVNSTGYDIGLALRGSF